MHLEMLIELEEAKLVFDPNVMFLDNKIWLN
jgi:hypothetical protein